MTLQNEILGFVKGCNAQDRPITESDIIAVFSDRYPRMDIIRAVRQLEFDHKLKWNCKTYLEAVGDQD